MQTHRPTINAAEVKREEIFQSAVGALNRKVCLPVF
jgi:hypothetical protein